MKENNINANYMNTDNEILNVNANPKKVNVINQNTANKGRKQKKKLLLKELKEHHLMSLKLILIKLQIQMKI